MKPIAIHILLLLSAILGLSFLANLAVAEETPAWIHTITPSGDFRLMYESIDEESKDQRERTRIRARVGIKAQTTDELDLYFRLATGVGDPRSGLVTLGDGMGEKDVYFDRAYFDWHPLTELKGTHIYGGKMSMPFVTTSDLIWDYDVAPEGVAVSQDFSLTDHLTLTATGGGFQVQERASEDETALYGGQLAAHLKVGEATKITAAGGYFAYSSLKGKPLIYNSTNSYGNSTTALEDGTLLYGTDFGEMEGILKIKHGTVFPVTAYMNFVNNTRASTDEDTGWLLGAILGEAVEPGSWQIDYNYRRLEADAVFALLSDLDSFGGGTNGKGHRICAAYQLNKKVQVGSNLFVNEKNIKTQPKDYLSLQFYVQTKF